MICNWRHWGLGGSVGFEKGEDWGLRIWLGPLRFGVMWRKP